MSIRQASRNVQSPPKDVQPARRPFPLNVVLEVGTNDKNGQARWQDAVKKLQNWQKLDYRLEREEAKGYLKNVQTILGRRLYAEMYNAMWYYLTGVIPDWLNHCTMMRHANTFWELMVSQRIGDADRLRNSAGEAKLDSFREYAIYRQIIPHSNNVRMVCQTRRR